MTKRGNKKLADRQPCAPSLLLGNCGARVEVTHHLKSKHLTRNLPSSWSKSTAKGFAFIHSNKVALPLKHRSKTASIFVSHRAPTLLEQLHVAFCGSVHYYCWVLRHTVTLIFENKEWVYFLTWQFVAHRPTTMSECKASSASLQQNMINKAKLWCKQRTDGYAANGGFLYY